MKNVGNSSFVYLVKMSWSEHSDVRKYIFSSVIRYCNFTSNFNKIDRNQLEAII